LLSFVCFNFNLRLYSLALVYTLYHSDAAAPPQLESAAASFPARRRRSPRTPTSRCRSRRPSTSGGDVCDGLLTRSGSVVGPRSFVHNDPREVIDVDIYSGPGEWEDESPRLYHFVPATFDASNTSEELEKPMKFVAVLSHNYTPTALKQGLYALTVGRCGLKPVLEATGCSASK